MSETPKPPGPHCDQYGEPGWMPPSPPGTLEDERAVTLMVDGLLQSIANLYSNVPSALEQAKRDGEKFRTALAALLDKVAREAQEDMRRRCVDSLQTPVGGVPAERITPRPWADIAARRAQT